jgi:hypothetical protein
MYMLVCSYILKIFSEYYFKLSTFYYLLVALTLGSYREIRPRVAYHRSNAYLIYICFVE